MAKRKASPAALVDNILGIETEEIPSITDLGLTTPIRRKLEEAIAKHMELGATLKAAERERDGLTLTIKDLLSEQVDLDETPTFYVPGGKLTMSPTKRTSINREKLLAQGVKPAVIAKATDVTETKRLLITPAKDE